MRARGDGKRGAAADFSLRPLLLLSSPPPSTLPHIYHSHGSTVLPEACAPSPSPPPPHFPTPIIAMEALFCQSGMPVS